MSYNDPQQGWSTRWPTEVVVRTAIVHAVMIANYIHLQHTQRVQHSSRTARILRFVLFGFMPSLVAAEEILNIFRIVLSLVQPDINKSGPREVFRDWRRYLCALAGMHVVPGPEQEEGIELADESHEGLLENGSDEDQLQNASTKSDNNTPRLVKMLNSQDLQRNTLPWTFQTVARLVLVCLPILQSAGTILLFARRLADPVRLRWPLELDKRNLVASTASLICSIAAIILLACRSEWSLKASNTANSDQSGGYVVRTLFLEITIASILNEAPFVEVLDVLPTSWSVTIARFLGVVGVILVICFGVVTACVVWVYDEQIKRKFAINWHFVLGLPMAAIVIWTLIDLIVFLVYDIVELSSFSVRDSQWDKDPIANYLPFCG